VIIARMREGTVTVLVYFSTARVLFVTHGQMRKGPSEKKEVRRWEREKEKERGRGETERGRGGGAEGGLEGAR